MGESMSVPSVLGPKSIKNHKVKEVNYLDPKNARNTKNELYQLYAQGKLVHIEKYTELEDQLNKLLNLTKDYVKQIRGYKDTIDILEKKVSKLEDQKKDKSGSSNDKQSDKYSKDKDSDRNRDKDIDRKMDKEIFDKHEEDEDSQ